jgi:hypothetical protein
VMKGFVCLVQGLLKTFDMRMKSFELSRDKLLSRNSSLGIRSRSLFRKKIQSQGLDRASVDAHGENADGTLEGLRKDAGLRESCCWTWMLAVGGFGSCCLTLNSFSWNFN